MKKGFTLIELLVSIAIASLLIGVLSMVFSLNVGFLNKEYIDEKDYKNASHAALYIEDKIRRAQKIKKIDGDNCNFILYISAYEKNRDKFVESAYRFSLEKGNVLYAYIYNTEEFSEREGKVRICEIEDLYLFYNDKDEDNKYIEMKIDSSTSSISTFINLGRRL
ncbi:MAG: type II secretion system protein [Anaerococcus prevotii]|uniref:PilW family protein n=1 Tax=Anaerococcus prevotii TaxID=33034 RepID=UPI00290470BC|nr:type II secretion system protein [Anaerococcus prevotii]MDU2557991.1 type II secretion system protein [Anaerococcus prevotii]MDU3137141.1 type II secretion system protein [Anaerococcus prevotii]